MSDTADGSSKLRTEERPLDLVIGVMKVIGDKRNLDGVAGVKAKSKKAREKMEGETLEHGELSRSLL